MACDCPQWMVASPDRMGELHMLMREVVPCSLFRRGACGHVLVGVLVEAGGWTDAHTAAAFKAAELLGIPGPTNLTILGVRATAVEVLR
jgi:hypothetical protein